MGIIVNGLGIGIIIAAVLSIYADTFFSNAVPIWMIYFIIAPFISAIVITIGLVIDRKKRDQYLIHGHYIEKGNNR